MATANSTCSLDGCEKIVNARGMCDQHYREWKKANPRTCKTCEGSMVGRPGRALYCSDECRACKIEGCGKVPEARGMCQMHYRRHMDGKRMVRHCLGCDSSIDHMSIGAKFCSSECKPRCLADGCDKPYRYSNGYCVKHGSMVRLHGTPIGKFEWREKASEYDCLSCREKFKPNGYSRKFCTPRCWATWKRHKGNIPSLDFTCTMCGVLVERKMEDGVRNRVDRMLCTGCQQAKKARHKSSPAELARRDGTNCGICGEHVNLDLRHPDPLSGSVDHIIPVALGGPIRDKRNLQLSHLSCNLSKQARLDRPVQTALPI